MNNKNFNTAFFSYEGQINRKDYAINTLILIGLILGLSLINPNVFVFHKSMKFIAYILTFVIGMFKYIAIFSILSQIYRRINDITRKKSPKISDFGRKLFIIIYAIPILLHFIVIFVFGNYLPTIAYFADIFLLFMFPIMIIVGIIIGFIKGT